MAPTASLGDQRLDNAVAARHRAAAHGRKSGAREDSSPDGQVEPLGDRGAGIVERSAGLAPWLKDSLSRSGRKNVRRSESARRLDVDRRERSAAGGLESDTRTDPHVAGDCRRIRKEGLGIKERPWIGWLSRHRT